MAGNRSQSLCQGKKCMKSYNPLPSSTRASKSPLPGPGKEEERANTVARILFLGTIGTSPGNVLALAIPALSHRTAKSGRGAVHHPSSAERGKSFHFFHCNRIQYTHATRITRIISLTSPFSVYDGRSSYLPSPFGFF